MCVGTERPEAKSSAFGQAGAGDDLSKPVQLRPVGAGALRRADPGWAKGGWVVSLLTDLRYAGRGLLKSPGVTAIAIVALALGIGLTTVMFSIVYGALHRGLPFEGAERIMHLERANPTEGIQSMEVTIHDYRDWAERQRSFTELGAFYTGTVNIRGTERAERYAGGFMTANSFDILGVAPILGRSFRPEEEQPGATQVVLLGYRVWQERYGGARDVLGQTVTVNGESGEIIGVLPEGFEFPILQEVWAPLRLDHRALDRGTGSTLEVFGKLAEGVSLDAAMTEFAGITEQLADEFPETNQGVTALMKPYTEEFIGDEERGVLYSMLFTVVLVLVIACANVADLLLARAAVRTRDLAIRSALGADRWRVVFQMLAEALVLAVVGAVLGTAIAWVGITLFDRAVSATDPPFWLVFRLDLPILLFVMGISMLAALVAGIIPAVKASSADLNSVLKDESRGSSGMRIGRLSRVLVVGEIAMSMALLVASGLMVKGVVTLETRNTRFRPRTSSRPGSASSRSGFRMRSRAPGSGRTSRAAWRSSQACRPPALPALCPSRARSGHGSGSTERATRRTESCPWRASRR